MATPGRGLVTMIVLGLAGCAAGRAEPRAPAGRFVAEDPGLGAPTQGGPSRPIEVAVPPCSAVADMGRYAVPAWVLLGRPSAAEMWPAGRSVEELEQALEAAAPGDPERPRLLLEVAYARLRAGADSPIPDWRQRARSEAVRALAMRIQEHPEAPDTDTTLYVLAWALADMNELDRARVVYHRLIRAHPTSRWVPFAYLAFAEHYFGQGDLEAAARFYEKVHELATPESHLVPFVLYRRAAMDAQREQTAAARAHMAELERALASDPAIPDGEALRAAAARDACGLAALP